MRNTSLTAAALLSAALLAPAGTATAAGETCQGQAATIVGTPGSQIIGTEGADVIVTNGATRVDALGGDDVVCATGQEGVTYLPSVTVILGTGGDTFTSSSSGQHYVYAGTEDGADTESDVIRDGGNGLVFSGVVGQPNADVIDLAFGELVWGGIQTAPGAVSMGSGGILGVRSARGDVRMDASGAVTGTDTVLSWTGRFERFVFTTSADQGRFTFRGTSGSEDVKVDAPTTFDRDIALRGGRDSYESNSLGGAATRIKGDGGRNQLLLELADHNRVRADLSRSRVTATEAGAEYSIRVRGFDDLIVSARRADVVGTNRANRIGVIACRTTITGRKGRDSLYADSRYRGLGTWTTPRCGTYKAKIHGGPGNDAITGSSGSDRLIGGPGKDIVMGRWGGRDVCQGEKLRECEKRI